MYYSYNYVPSDYLCHYGVQGMKWGQHLMNRWEQKRADRKATKAAVNTEKQKLLASYNADSPTKRAANSAARAYYRAQRTKEPESYQRANRKAERKQASLNEEQIKGGRYRVASARNIRRKVASVAVGTLAAGGVGAASVATGGLAAAVVLGASAGSIAGVSTNLISGGHYYAKEAKAYGVKRAKLQAKENIYQQKQNS